MVGPVRHYIFGYGSLICPLSRSITAPTLAGVPAIPALIYHMERTWSARIDGPNQQHNLYGFTAMGVRFRRGCKCSGVLIEVDEEELRRFDIREEGYDRKLIELEHIHRIPNLGGDDDIIEDDEDHVIFRRSELARQKSRSVDDEATSKDGDFEEKKQNEGEDEDGYDPESEPDAFLDTTLDVAEDDDIRVWVYLQQEHRAADKKYPIHQSYVDIILRGCLSISEGFARSFLDTTHGWYHDGDGGDICYNEQAKQRENGGEGCEGGGVCTDSCGGGGGGGKRKENGEGVCDSAVAAAVDDDHHTWIEDRLVPLYVRADPHYSNSFGHKIDALVRDHHPQALDKRRKLVLKKEDDSKLI